MKNTKFWKELYIHILKNILPKIYFSFTLKLINFPWKTRGILFEESDIHPVVNASVKCSVTLKEKKIRTQEKSRTFKLPLAIIMNWRIYTGILTKTEQGLFLTKYQRLCVNLQGWQWLVFELISFWIKNFPEQFVSSFNLRWRPNGKIYIRGPRVWCLSA